MTCEQKGLAALAHEALPDEFTLRHFHAVVHAMYGYCECTSKRILSQLMSNGYIEIIRGTSRLRVAVYCEKRTKN